VKEIKAANLAPVKTGKDEWVNNLIGWARCDQHGEGWVVSVGDGPGRARVFVEPNGRTRLLEDENAPWKLCFPRDVEPKGMYTSLARPSDDYTQTIWFKVPGHGAWSNYPIHWTGKDDDAKVIPENDNNFGFLPGSHDVFIGENVNGSSILPIRTWFFGGDGKCRGWTRRLSYRLGRLENHVVSDENCVVTLDLDSSRNRARACRQRANAKPVKLFTNLRVGFSESTDNSCSRLGRAGMIRDGGGVRLS
jgi:hypothetical protein